MPSFADANSVLSGFVPTDSAEEPEFVISWSIHKNDRQRFCEIAKGLSDGQLALCVVKEAPPTPPWHPVS